MNAKTKALHKKKEEKEEKHSHRSHHKDGKMDGCSHASHHSENEGFEKKFVKGKEGQEEDGEGERVDADKAKLRGIRKEGGKI